MQHLGRRAFLAACAAVAIGSGRLHAGPPAEHSYLIHVDGMT